MTHRNNIARQVALPALVLAAVVFGNARASAEDVKCPVTRDAWLSAANQEESKTNGGASPRIKLKQWQEFGLFDFDVSALKGKRIAKAVLYLAPDGGAVYGQERGTDLRWFSVSTISADWVEGQGTNYSVDEKGKGATFLEASHGVRPWTVPGSRAFDVILGNGHSLRDDVDGGDPQNGWFGLPIDKRLVEALVAGAGHGLMVMDGSTSVRQNCYISSKEGKKPPYLLVTVDGADAQAPAAPAGLAAEPAPNDADAASGAVWIRFKAPAEALCARVRVDGKDLPRWQAPFLGEVGQEQRLLVEHLPPGKDVKIDVAAVDGAGNASPDATVTVKTSPAVSAPELPASTWAPKGGTPPQIDGTLRAWAFPDGCKLDPLNAKILIEPGTEQAASKNTVWDAGTSTVRVVAARGEIAAFQLALEALGGPLEDVTVGVEGLAGMQTRCWRTWFVNVKGTWQAEYAIPLAAGTALALPAKDNNIPGQKAAVVAVDLIVPADAKPGVQAGTVTVASGGKKVALKLQMDIRAPVIPKEIHFNPELNCYGGPAQAGSEAFFDAYRLAHYHRCTINRVPYSQGGGAHSDWVPAVGADGRVTDWSNFDKNLGPLLDGSAFQGNPRAGVPVPTLYLPFFENWPIRMEGHYRPGPQAVTSGKDWKEKHDIHALPVEKAFDAAYQDGFVNAVADFVKHFEEKGWTRTQAECYLNNKQNAKGMTSSAWTLDEPYELLDWRALRFYSQLFHKGTKDARKAQFVFRGDISRPEWQGNYMDGMMEVMYANSGQFGYFPLMKAHKRRMPAILYCYGAANPQYRATHETVAWCLKAYVYECDGVLPWQIVGNEAAFDKGDDAGNGNALFVNGSKRFGVNAVASFRVHAFRSGAQLVELLRLLQLKRGWGRPQIGALIEKVLSLKTDFRQARQDDASEVTFEGLSGEALIRLKEAVLDLLEAK